MLQLWRCATRFQPLRYDLFTVEKIRVKLNRNSYHVLIGAGLLRQSGHEISLLLPSKSSRVFVITSPNVRRHWGQQLEASLQKSRLNYQVLEMNDGEPAKRLATVEQLAEQMVSAGADRKALIVAL